MQVSSSNQIILVNGLGFFLFFYLYNLVRNYTNISRDSNRVSPIPRPMHLVDRLVRLNQSPTHHNLTILVAKVWYLMIWIQFISAISQRLVVTVQGMCTRSVPIIRHFKVANVMNCEHSLGRIGDKTLQRNVGCWFI